jgi:hypothetical protein
MKSAKYVLFVFALLALALCTTGVSALNVEITKVEMDRVDLNPSSTNSIYSFDRNQEVEVRVQFKSLENTTVLKDVQIEARIRGYDQREIIGDITDAFDVMPGVTYTKDLTLKLPIKLDQKTYKLRVSVVDADGVEVYKTYELEVEADSHAIWIKEVMTNPEEDVAAGRALLTTVRVKNVGNNDEDEGIRIKVSIPDLGLSATDYIDSLDEDESVTSEELYMRIPSCAKPGEYEMVVEVTYRDGDESEEETKIINVIKGDTCETSTPNKPVTPTTAEPTIVASSTVQDVIAGQGGVIYPLTITNNDASAKTFVISTDAENWASIRISPSNVVVIDAGQTQSVYVYLSAKEDSPIGQNVFAINVKSGGNTLKQYTMTANVVEKQEEPKKEIDWAKVKRVLEITLVVIIILLLILALILGLRKLARGNDRGNNNSGNSGENDVDAQAYY